MGKKHRKHGGHGQNMAYGAAPQYGMPAYGAPPAQAGYGAGTAGWQQMGEAASGMAGNAPGAPHGAHHHGPTPGRMGADYGAGYGPAYGAGMTDSTLLQGLPAFLRTRQTEQFLLGAMVGAAAAWVLSDEELRGKLVKAGMKLYTTVAAGFEEMKEQMSDIKAEVEAERHGDA